jgi:hypothetical protein
VIRSIFHNFGITYTNPSNATEGGRGVLMTHWENRHSRGVWVKKYKICVMGWEKNERK